jgi:ATP-dependent DNA ligase
MQQNAMNVSPGAQGRKMTKAVWLKPEAVAQIEFLEWTERDRLRHSKFVGLREDKNPRSVVKEQAGEP